MSPSIKTARILYLVFILASSCGIYVTSQIFVIGNVESSVSNILDNEFLFRSEVVLSIITFIIFFFLVLVLNRIFNRVDRRNSKLMLALVIAQIPLSFLVNIFGISILTIFKGKLWSSYDFVSMKDFVNMYLKMWNFGNYIEEIYWGLWLIPGAILIYRLGNIPPVYILLLIIGFAAWIINCVTFFLFPGQLEIVSLITMVFGVAAEISFTFWLIKRVKEYKENVEDIIA